MVDCNQKVRKRMMNEKMTADNLANNYFANRRAMLDRANDQFERAELGACYGCKAYHLCEGCTKPNALYAR